MTPKIFARHGGQETGKSTLSTVKKKRVCISQIPAALSFILFFLPLFILLHDDLFFPFVRSFFLFFLNGCVLSQFFTIDRYPYIDTIYHILLLHLVSSIFSRRCNRVSLHFPLFHLRLLFSYRRYRDYISARISKPIDIDRTLLHPRSRLFSQRPVFSDVRVSSSIAERIEDRLIRCQCSVIRLFRERLLPLGLPIVEFFRRSISIDLIKS